MPNRIKVGIVFGGRSAEHQVSLQSAKSIVDAIDQSRYEPVLIGITTQGQWLIQSADTYLEHADDPSRIQMNTDAPAGTLVAGANKGELRAFNNHEALAELDVLFPVLHGPYGEDGSIQGLAKLANLPCVGSGIVGSAAGMDKDVTKRLLMHAGLNVADYALVRYGKLDDALIADIETRLHYPVFVKPANMGSSIGVSKANDREALMAAVAKASEYDRKVLVEATVTGREIECAMLGNVQPEASICGEVKAQDGFYDYESKYIDADGAQLMIPANLTEAQTQAIQQVATQAFEALECRGLARVDVFLTPDDKVIINEINTLPGFTRISMYPKLWAESGLPYPALIDKLIQLAIEDHQIPG